MPDANAVETATPKSAQFKIFSGALTPFEGDDGKKRLRTIASSSVEDLGGDVVTQQALQHMAESAKGMTIFRNHSYKVPQDILGTTEKAEVRHAGADGHGKPIYDLVLDVVVMDSPDNNQTYDAVQAGVQLGTSIGAMIPQGGARKGDNGGYIFDDLRLLEASIVGIPQNPRSWVQYAKSAITKVEDDDDGFTNEAFNTEKGTAWMETTPDGGMKVTIQTDAPEAPEAAKAATIENFEVVDETGEPDEEIAMSADDFAEVILKGPCPDCGGDAGHPKGDCSNDMHKEADPDLRKEMEGQSEPSDDLPSEAGEESPAQEPGDGDPESAEAEPAEEEGDAPDSKEAQAALHATVTRSADVLADLVKTLTRERVVLLTQIADTEKQRDEATQRAKDAEANLQVAKDIVQKIANSPLGRKAVYREAVNDFNVRLSGIYSPEILKQLEKKNVD